MDTTGLIFVAVALVMLLGVESRIGRADKRVARVERKLDLIMDHLGLREEDPRMDEVVALAREGKKIPAIKAYREITGAGLKEAKDAVERIV
ncbi:ribosomal protein L7/L12 [Streptomyces sp. NPDC007808]|uniref:ribosomal protein L7/L12 n=1 Tax=Streptomyces sp. NPDC007808 TaxID=3364779 RepID=UPI003689222B